jgi:RNA polymerase sporulation-specific sigma factor
MLEEELVYNYRLGREEALGFLFSLYEKKVTPFIIQYENIFRMAGYDSDDIKMFIRDCVLKAIKGYRFGNKSFNTYYSAIASRNIIALYRKTEGTYDERINASTISLSDYTNEEKFSYQEETKKEIDLELLLSKIKGMTDCDHKVLELYLEGKTYHEISQILNITSKKVCNHLQKIKNKMKKCINN